MTLDTATPQRTCRHAPGWLLMLLACAAFAGAGHAQQATNETQAFAVAKRAFSDAVYDIAERQFAEFARTFPQSPQLPEAILFQAQAALHQQKVDAALAALSAHVAQAGALADQFHYWQGKAHLQAGNYTAAADTFAQLVKQFADSVLLLEASYSEAEARFKLGQFDQVVALLQRPDSLFQKAVKVRATDELATRGLLLLADALLMRNDFKTAEQTLSSLAETNLVPEFKWRRQYALCRTQLADQRPEAALDGTAHLLTLAAAAAQPALLAESVALQAHILHRLSRLESAAATYARNLADDVPAAYRRQALVRVVELTLAQNKTVEAAQRLREFLTRHPEDAAADLALLTLGEVHLKLWTQPPGTNTAAALAALAPPPATTNAPAATNHLQAALAQFDQLIATATNSPFLGKAYLNRGWCLWLQDKIPDSLGPFAQASANLALSEDLAVARFKLADVQFRLNDLTNALHNYQSVVKDFEAFPRVRNSLFDHALYQVLRVSLQLDNLADASTAMQKILEWFPDSAYRDRSMLLVGQGLGHADQTTAARELFADLAQRMPDSPLIPEIELAVARTFVQERQWNGALEQYGRWIERFPTNALRPRAEFNRAWASYQAGLLTNALALFTNFVAQFPQHELAPRAQFWVGSFYYDQKDFVNAEKNFQNKLLLQNTNFAHQARMMAGRAAFARQQWKDAYDHFTAIVNDNEAMRRAPDIAAEAFFAMGDTMVQQEADPNEPMAKFVEAQKAFRKVALLFPASPLVPRAWGRIGDCHLQMGALDPKQFEAATNAYLQVLPHPAADVNARSQAEVGLGHALKFLARTRSDPERQPLLDAAFEHYYNVVSEKNLRPGERPDPFWFKEAGLHAGSLAEQTGRWQAAENIYQRIAQALPHFRAPLDKKIENVRQQHN